MFLKHMVLEHMILDHMVLEQMVLGHMFLEHMVWGRTIETYGRRPHNRNIRLASWRRHAWLILLFVLHDAFIPLLALESEDQDREPAEQRHIFRNRREERKI